MSYHRSLILMFMSVFLFQISSIHSTPLISEITSDIINENEEYQRTHNTLNDFIKNVLDEPNPYERTLLLNQLREYLNRMCVIGFFGPSHAHSCQRLVDVIHQSHINNHINDEENIDISNEQHGIQKRFFCNGFIGCRKIPSL